MFEDHPEKRENASRIMVAAWANGEYDGVAVGQCDWHDLTLKDGSVIKLQGSWEYAYAKLMDEQGIEFTVHHGRIPYVDDNEVKRNYYPDFIMTDGTFVDIKSPLYEDKHARKLQLVREQNDVVIEVIGVDKLTALGLLFHKMPVKEYLPPKMQLKGRAVVD